MSAATVIKEFADGLLDNVVHDVGGSVINAAGLLDFRLVVHHGAVAFREPDDLAQELLIDLAENVGGKDGKLIRAFGIIQTA